MANKDKKKVGKIKVKKKTWVKVIAPKTFGSKVIGESYLNKAEDAVGRSLKVNLKDLTGNIKDQNAYVYLNISKVTGGQLNTAITGYQLTPAYVKRMVRKNSQKIDDYAIFKTKSGREVIAKILVTTLNKTQKSVLTEIRKALAKLLQEEIGKSDFATFVNILVTRRFQIGAKKKLNKICPLKEVSVRVLKLKGKDLAQEEIVVNDESKEVVEKAEEVTEVPVEEEKKEAPVEKAETPKEEVTEEQPEVEKETAEETSVEETETTTEKPEESSEEDKKEE
jgi:small subunit ribosomal protein S3Ae